jgi:DNA-binding response OmpR family regulator
MYLPKTKYLYSSINKFFMDNKKPKILLCEDDTNLGMVLKNYLELNDYEVVLERDGRLGLAAFQREKFDICLLDVMMPKINGLDVLKKMREQQDTKDIPVIVLTALIQDREKMESITRGADDYIVKSETMPGDVIQKVKVVLEKRAAGQAPSAPAPATNATPPASKE